VKGFIEALNGPGIYSGKKIAVNFYKDVPLYYCTKDKKFVLYKSSGITLFDMRIEECSASIYYGALPVLL